MIIVQVEAKNCYSFDHIKLLFSQFSVVQIIGNNLDEQRISKDDGEEFYSNANGVGKTNLYNLIIQALYSKDIYKTKKAYLSNLYSKSKFEIIVDLIIDNEKYKVVYNNNECILYKNKDVFIEGRQNITEFFEELIPFELFLRLTYLSPKIYLPFFESTNKEQQEFLSLIFKDLLTLKNKLPKIKKERQDLQKNILELEKDQHHLEQQTKESYENEKELPKKFEICDQTEAINTLNREKGKLQQQFTRYKELEDEIKKIKIIPCNYDEKRYLALYSEGKQLNDKVQKTRQLILKIENLEGTAYCPTCLQKINHTETEKHLTQLKEELSRCLHDLEVCRSEYSALQKEKEINEQNNKNTQRLQEINNQLNKYNIEELRTEIKQLTIKIQNLQETQKEEERKLKEYQEKVTSIKIFNEKQRLIKSQISSAYKKLKKVNQSLLEAKKSLKILTILEEVCSKVVVAKQIPNRLKILESFINTELANYTSQYSIKLSMKNDKIIREITKEGKTYPVENLSSGEKTRLNIALLFAIRNILSALQKDVYNVNIIFFDEVFGTLDSSGRNILIDTINDYGLNQLIISHGYIHPDYPILELVRKNNKTIIKEH